MRCLRSKGESWPGVIGVLGTCGPREGGRLCGRYTDVPIDSRLEERDLLSYSYSVLSSPLALLGFTGVSVSGGVDPPLSDATCCPSILLSRGLPPRSEMMNLMVLTNVFLPS